MQKNNEYYNQVLELCSKNISHKELIDFLENGNIAERQFAALNLDCVNDFKEAKIVLSNLVGVDGKIREAAALKIYELTQKTPELFLQYENFKIFSNASIDIDGNVCRLAISCASNLKIDSNFAFFYAEEMIKIINNALNEISTFTFKDKKYKINKQIFKIYWCLEAMTEFHEYANYNDLKTVIIKCSKLQEYTVREKCAKILCKCQKDDELTTLKNKLKNDENYYVRSVLEN